MDIFAEREGLNSPLPDYLIGFNTTIENKLEEIASKKKVFKDNQLRKLTRNSQIINSVFMIMALGLIYLNYNYSIKYC